MNSFLERRPRRIGWKSAVALGAIALCAALPALGEPLPLGDVLACEMETYLVLDARDTLAGKWIPLKNAAAQAVLSGAEIRELRMRLEPLTPGAQSQGMRLEFSREQLQHEMPFTIPLGGLRGGYYRLHGELVGKDGVIASKGEAVFDHKVPVILALRQLRTGLPDKSSRDYLAFVTQTVERLIEHQSATLGGEVGGARFITVSRALNRSYRSIGFKKDDGSYQNFWFPETPMDYEPFMADFESWILLDRLSELTGDARYRNLTSAMADAFARNGFDPQCGLGYLGEEAGFDALHMRNVAAKARAPMPEFKPKNTGTYPQLPLDRLWAHAPEQTHRMFRAMFFGLVTDAASMDFNRFCPFTFKDADQRPALTRNPGHCGFDTAGGRMIHWWSSCFARTGDTDCLGWAQQMADKWRAVQHAESGLIPNFFGGEASDEGAPMPVGRWAETRGAALTATSWIDAAAELRKRPGGGPLAEQLTQMALKLALGVARHAYDPERRVFRNHLHLDGRPYVETARYTFRTQVEKDAAVRLDPVLQQVKVYDGSGFYQPCSYWEHCAGVSVPLWIAQVMAATGDGELTAILRGWARDIIEESRNQQAAITGEGAWTFRASGEYVRLLVLLYQTTKDAHDLDAAREIADRELAGLEQVGYPEWWRMPERTALLDGLLALHEALATRR